MTYESDSEYIPSSSSACSDSSDSMMTPVKKPRKRKLMEISPDIKSPLSKRRKIHLTIDIPDSITDELLNMDGNSSKSESVHSNSNNTNHTNNSNNDDFFFESRIKFSEKKNAPVFDINKFKPKLKELSLLELINLGNDFVNFCKQYSAPTKNPSYSEIEYTKIASIHVELEKINSMIGLESFKSILSKQILYFVQGMHGSEMMNIIITGPPGCGKTTLANFLGSIYRKLGILSKGTFHVASRTDFVAGYLGQTANKTRKFLDKCLGGVVFIDEAYSLGIEKNDSDSFSMEAINTLNQYLSENRDIICILAGYKENIKNNFLSLNPGLERRFPWTFDIRKYTSYELAQIFLYRLYEEEWFALFTEDDIHEYFKDPYFKNQGGDCENLLNKCKIKHSERVFTLSEKDKRINRFSIDLNDFKNGLEFYKKSMYKTSDKYLDYFI